MPEPRSQRDRACVLHDPDFWKRVKQAPFRLLCLDYDGTLAPFRIRRMEAVPLSGVRAALGNLRSCSQTQLVIVSGRPVREIVQLLGDADMSILGSHGYERKFRGQDIAVFPPSSEAIQGLTMAVESTAAAGLSWAIERKIGSVALHVRGHEPAHEILARGKELWQPLTVNRTLAIRSFCGGIELRATERNKGTAVAELMETLPPGSLTIHVGDDDTDEDIFQMLHRRSGIGIRVGSPNERTAADARLDNPEQVLEFLLLWQNTVCGADIPEDR